MSVNPGALLLLVFGVVALIVGLRGTQKNAAQLLTGVSVSGGLPKPAPKPSSSPTSGLNPPMGTHPAVGAGGGGGGGGSW